MESINLVKGIKDLCANRSLLLLIICFSSFIGLFFSLGNVMSSMFNPFGQTPSNMAVIGLIMLGSGFVGATVTGIILDKTSAYKKAIQI